MARTQHLLAALILCAFTPLAHAGLIRMDMSGTITSSNMTAFALGQQIYVSFTYESDGAPQSVQFRQAFYVDHFTSVSVTSGGYSSGYTGHFGQINKYDNLSNTDGISFQFANPAGHYQFTNPLPAVVPLSSVFSNNVTQTFGNFWINLASSSNAVWNNYALPTSYDLADFNATNNINMGFSGGSFSAGFNSLIAGPASEFAEAPEPGTAGIALLAVGILAAWGRSRRCPASVLPANTQERD